MRAMKSKKKRVVRGHQPLADFFGNHFGCFSLLYHGLPMKFIWWYTSSSGSFYRKEHSSKGMAWHGDGRYFLLRPTAKLVILLAIS
mmetsp:Transcript_11253/g.32450  ORF Transcript_11253/g.32450 Transcript_11253/m.32450 type:complete len:86 (+) Transcript_11253:79-336(+)